MRPPWPLGGKLSLMPWDAMFDIGAVMTRLHPAVMTLTRPRTAADFASALPEFMALPRYQDSQGPDRLLHDFEEAIDALPVDPELAVQDRTWARLITGLDQPRENLTSRRRDLDERNGSVKKHRDRYVIQFVLHRLQLMALEAPPGTSQYDCGFEVQAIEARVLARTRYALNVRHTVTLRLRAMRGGQRLVPLCYGGTIPFSTVTASVSSAESLEAKYLGTTAAVTDDPRFPTHFFWLSSPPIPGSPLTVQVELEEVHSHPWGDLHTWLRLITGDSPSLRFTVDPRRSFRQVRGYRLTANGTKPTQEFQAGRRPKGELPAYKARARGDEAFHIHCTASDKAKEHQRRINRASQLPL
jgi:hypothetical protein